MAAVECTEPGCPDAESHRLFANPGALRFHAIAKHGADSGHCDLCDQDFDRLSQHQKKAHPPQAEPPPAEPVLPFDGEVVEPSPERAPSTADYDTSAPSSNGRPRLADRIKSKMWGKDKTAGDAPPTGTAGAGSAAGPGNLYGTKGEKKPRTGAKRSTTAPILSLIWGGVGAWLERSGVDVPVGRTLQFQQGAAGDILDRLVANTWADRVLQPFAEKTDDVEALAALVALPVLIATVERSQAAAVTLEPLLREAVRANLTAMAPVVKKRKADDKKFAEAVALLDPELAASGADPIDAILSAIFRGPPGPPPPHEQPPVGVDDLNSAVGI